MSLSANMRDDTGRRAKTVKLTAEEEELRIQLQYFEARYDPEDADQVAVRLSQSWEGFWA
jgi:CRISPR/Cas system-associated endoribonuclease Cas2